MYIRTKYYIFLAILLSLTGCKIYKPVATKVTFNKAFAHDGSPYEQMMDQFASAATNYLKLSQEKMAEGDSIAELIEDTTITSSGDADSLLNVSYSNMLEGDKIERYQKSIEYANEALIVAKQTGERAVEKKIYRQLSNVYQRLDNQEYANYYKRKSDEITDTVASSFNTAPDEIAHTKFRQYWWIIAIAASALIALLFVILLRHRNEKQDEDVAKTPDNDMQQPEPDDIPVLINSKANNNAELKPGWVVYLKSYGNYTTIYYLDNRNHLISTEICQSMSSILATLSAHERFFRCHRSYAVNMRYVTSWNDFNVQLTCTQPVPLSKTYLEKFENANISVHESE